MTKRGEAMRRILTILVVVAALSGVLIAPAGAGNHDPVVFTVNNVADLYANASLTNVVISLAPGAYVLDPSRPNGGRLILGDGTELVSTLELQLDAHGVPTGTELEAGASSTPASCPLRSSTSARSSSAKAAESAA